MTTQISIRGYLVGPIWWPAGAECWKNLNYDLTRERDRYVEPPTTLREHVLAATRDGDFQHCVIAQGEIVIERSRMIGRDLVRKIRYYPLEKFHDVADCLHDDPDWFPDSGEE
jgi:hypothetical protein